MEEDKICATCEHFGEVDVYGVGVCYKAHRAITTSDNTCDCYHETEYWDEEEDEDWEESL